MPRAKGELVLGPDEPRVLGPPVCVACARVAATEANWPGEGEKSALPLPKFGD
jgi:hypothetical protein